MPLKAEGEHALPDDPVRTFIYRRVMDGDPEREARRPIWDDACGHGIKAYMGSIPGHRGYTGGNPIDIYVFDDNGDAAVCLRFGHKGPQYLSVGNVMDVFNAAMFAPDGDSRKFSSQIALVLLRRLDFLVNLKPKR